MYEVHAILFLTVNERSESDSKKSSRQKPKNVSSENIWKIVRKTLSRNSFLPKLQPVERISPKSKIILVETI